MRKLHLPWFAFLLVALISPAAGDVTTGVGASTNPRSGAGCATSRRRGGAGGGGRAATMAGAGAAVASDVAEGVEPNQQVPTPSGEGNIGADAAHSSGVRQLDRSNQLRNGGSRECHMCCWRCRGRSRSQHQPPTGGCESCNARASYRRILLCSLFSEGPLDLLKVAR